MRITSPDPTYTGVDRYGLDVQLHFADGVAEAEDLPHAVRAYLTGAGYTFDEDPVAVLDLTALKINELKAYAAEHGIDLGGAAKKADLVAVIAAAAVPPVADPNGEQEPPADPDADPQT